MRETIFCAMVTIVVTVLYMIAGAVQRGWVDIMGAAALLVLIAPLAIFWAIYRNEAGEEKHK